MSRNNNKLSSKDIMPASIAAFAGATTLAVLKAREARYKATHDELTGLLNARGLSEKLKRAKDPVAVLYVDATNLKGVNDKISHERGNEAICGTANIITSGLRPNDLAARMGGDEFLVILNSRGRDKVNHTPNEVAESVRSRIIEDTHTFLGHNMDLVEVGFDLAAGVAVFKPGMTIGELEKAAEADMYSVKQRQHEEHGQYRKA
jgi:diguanylate cyclase (GGDEF)-like protein